MSKFENLQSCIERCEVAGETFYYDTRFGTKIMSMHPSYKKCFSAIAQPVDSVESIIREENTFHVRIKSKGLPINISIKFYPCDKTFVCRDYDPSVIIPAILQDSNCREYLESRKHPMYNFGYVADYLWSPDCLNKWRDSNLDYDPDEELIEIQRTLSKREPSKKKGLAYLNELDWYNPESRIQEPVSDCESCVGDDPPFASEITQADLEEIEAMFGGTGNVEKKLDAYNDELDFWVPRKPLKKIESVKSEINQEIERMKQEQMRQQIAEIKRLRDLQQLMAEMPPWTQPSGVPKIDERIDNL